MPSRCGFVSFSAGLSSGSWRSSLTDNHAAHQGVSSWDKGQGKLYKQQVKSSRPEASSSASPWRTCARPHFLSTFTRYSIFMNVPRSVWRRVTLTEAAATGAHSEGLCVGRLHKARHVKVYSCTDQFSPSSDQLLSVRPKHCCGDCRCHYHRYDDDYCFCHCCCCGFLPP